MAIVSGIYAIVHRDSGKIYLGSSNDIERRWYEHRFFLVNQKHVNKHLQRAYDAHGQGAFTLQVLEVVADTSTLLAREQAWMDKVEDRSMYYNASWIAGGLPLWRDLSPEQREERRSSLARAWTRASTRALHVAAMDDEYRREMAAFMESQWHERGEEMSDAIRASWTDSTVRSNRVAGLIRSWADPVVRSRHAAYWTAERRVWASEISKLRWQRPGYREKMSVQLGAASARPEVKASRSAAAVRSWADDHPGRASKAARGERVSKAKLCEADVREVHRLLSLGVSQSEIAARYNVTGTTIYGIASGLTWRHVPNEYGPPPPGSRLSADVISEVRRRVASGETQVSVARDLRVSPGHVSCLVRGLSRKASS